MNRIESEEWVIEAEEYENPQPEKGSCREERKRKKWKMTGKQATSKGEGVVGGKEGALSEQSHPKNSWFEVGP